MLELREWFRTCSLPDRPWLLLGKGPTFSLHTQLDLSGYNTISLNHAVRERRVDVAHIIDVDVVETCADALLENCRYLLMPRRPHVKFDPGRLALEDFVKQIPVLQELDRQNRLVWYNLSSGKRVGDSPVIRAKYFSAEAALNALAALGVKKIRSLGVDGGRGYSPAFKDLEGKTMLANGHQNFNIQFEHIRQIVKEHAIDYAPLAEPLRVFVGTDRSQMVATRVLEHSIRKHSSRPVEFTPMIDMPVPKPKDPKNRPRTGFSFYRFLIPKLCGYQGRALYVDADMLVFSDLAELWKIPFGEHKVLCTNQPERPDAWKDDGHFQPGRQMSVMLLDCSRLQWDVDEIVGGLDKGRYTYAQLMFDLCLVEPHEIADLIPPEWNCLEWHAPGKSKLVHFTVVPTQPWKNDQNPLREVWESAYREAVEAGAVPRETVADAIRAGLVKPELAKAWKDELQEDLQAAGAGRRGRASPA